jgi:hypothetical protein
LTEQGKDVPAATQEVRLAGPDVAAVVRLEYRPAKAGETTLVLEARAVGGEPALAPALVEHRLQVLDPQRLRCLLIEGGPRYEYRYLKALLGRQTEPETGRPSIDLQVLLGDADPGFAGIDAAARAGWPGPRDLAGLDLVILGDVDPARIQPGDLEALRDQVRQGGTGLIVLGGPHFQPNAYRGTALAEVLPIELPAAPRPAGDAEPWLPQPTPAGRAHPLFRDWPDDAAGRLPPLVAPPETAPARSDAVVLATHPRGGRPVALERRYGAGRCVYLGFAETWRWQGLDLEPLYARFWLQLLRHAARQRPTRPLLTLDRPPPYRRGEGLTLLVHDPADRPADGRRWLVVRPPDGGPPRVEALQAVPGSFGVWQWRIDHLEEGAYRFALGPRPEEGPTLECQVLGPPTEADRTALDEAALRAAAAAGGGAYFPLEKADDLWDRLPPAGETPLGPAWETPVWDHPYLWLLILGLLGGEWAWRRRQGLP